MSRGRHRAAKSHPLARRVGVGAAAAALSAGTLAAFAAPASADTPSGGGDKVRCVGAIQVEGAFACWTSPRFDHIGLDKTAIADFPVICYGAGCTGDELIVYTPATSFAGRFIAVYYLGHTYTVYRPDDAQPYILTSDNPGFDAATAAQVLLLEAALEAANQ